MRGLLSTLGPAAFVTAEMLGDAIRVLLNDSNRAKALGEAAFALVDGEGRTRVVACLQA
ncbi:hypothetical protein ACVWW2_006161 [Bradyrhizobium sp. LM4.3]